MGSCSKSSSVASTTTIAIINCDNWWMLSPSLSLSSSYYLVSFSTYYSLSLLSIDSSSTRHDSLSFVNRSRQLRHLTSHHQHHRNVIIELLLVFADDCHLVLWMLSSFCLILFLSLSLVTYFLANTCRLFVSACHKTLTLS